MFDVMILGFTAQIYRYFGLPITIFLHILKKQNGGADPKIVFWQLLI